MPTVKLSYFDIQGRAEIIRILLHAGNIDFEDQRIPFDGWPDHNLGMFPAGSVPVLYWDGEELLESMAITRFVAMKAGLAGKTDLQFTQADMILEHCNDFTNKWVPRLRWTNTQEDREKGANEMLFNSLPTWLTQTEALLKKRGGKWFAGSMITFGDIAVMVLLDCLMAAEEMCFKDMANKGERRKMLETFPLLIDHYQRTCALPAVANYRKKRPAFTGY